MKSKFETVTLQKTGLAVICHRCFHRWTYCGSRCSANCPSCHTTVTFNAKKEKSVQEVRPNGETKTKGWGPTDQSSPPPTVTLPQEALSHE